MSELSDIRPHLTSLASIETIGEAKEIRDRAAGLEAYAREAKDRELMDHAVEVRVKAEREVGRQLTGMGERRGGDQTSDERSLPSNADLGITDKQSHLWQRLAGMSDEAFAERLKEAQRVAWSSIDKTPAERQAEKRERREERERELGARQLAYPDKIYGLILCDDEWDHEVWSRETGMDRHAANHYPTAGDAHTAEEIHERTKRRLTPADDCVLAMWTTNQHLAVAVELMALRGFRYVTNYCWGKDKIGLGYWNRERHELLLIGIRGAPPAPASGTQWDSLVMAPRAEHSAKPECFLEMLEEYFPTLPKIEINRRGPPRSGWDAWGNEVQQPNPGATE
jgi:N6-adenosine-specific RNA methylase IME4